MSGTIAIALASLLMQQATPHPSTLKPYRPPAVRPYEPPSSFGRERAEGDDTGEVYRGALAAPVVVEDYRRSYEYSPRDAETLYDQAVTTAEMRADRAAGPLDGGWRVLDAHGAPLADLVISDRDPSREGGWRRGSHSGVVIVSGAVLTLEGLGVLTVTPKATGWSGSLHAGGHDRAVTVVRPD